MTDEMLNEIAARVEKATPGPWDVNAVAGKPFREVFCDDVLIADTGCEPTITDEEIEANSEFISHASQDIPDLLAEVKRLRLALEDAPHDEGCSYIDGILRYDALGRKKPAVPCNCWKASL